VRPQLDERDDAFVAVEMESLDYGDDGWPNGRLRICRQGMEKRIEPSDCLFCDDDEGVIPRGCVPGVGDLDMRSLENQEFKCPLWRGRECAVGVGKKGRGEVGRGVC
jgi:hypothetical protein